MPDPQSAAAVGWVGHVLAGHRIDALIGEGGMGVVYRATHLQLRRTVALKVLSPSLAADQDYRRRFEREAAIAASLEHPNVVPIYEAGHADGVAAAQRSPPCEDTTTSRDDAHGHARHSKSRCGVRSRVGRARDGCVTDPRPGAGWPPSCTIPVGSPRLARSRWPGSRGPVS